MATQSLYRRYRPRRFSEIKGQPHIVKALRDAVASGREGQAYLFSGPRGTGKTTSARILAKVLNCEHVVDGEPCCECESCQAVEVGTSYDVHELDAASNNGVDAIRDLIKKASLGTPGRHKVYILDEVHMLSPGAEAALLKTLEEPPPHVVFVLATTDPQKMSDTIRSRTQHLQFHLLPADELAEHVRWVASDAGLDLSDEALEAALARGGGSARDTLSALELLVATGGEVGDTADLEGFVQAFIDADPGAALSTMAQAVSLGLDPRAITEDLVRRLRDGFLSLMAPELVIMAPDRLAELADQARQLGPAALVRAIERLGEALTDMRNAPDPRVLVEVALVQLTHAPASSDLVDLTARIDRLEQRIAAGPTATATASAVAAPSSAPAAPPASAAPSAERPTGRKELGGAARRAKEAALRAQRHASEPATEAAPPAQAAAPKPAPAPEAASPPKDASVASAEAITAAWDEQVKRQLKPMVRALYSAGDLEAADGVAHFRVTSDTQRDRCRDGKSEVERMLTEAVGAPVTVEVSTVDNRDAGTSDAGGGDAETGRSESEFENESDIDLDDLTDAPPDTVKTPLDQLADAFPGSEMIES